MSEETNTTQDQKQSNGLDLVGNNDIEARNAIANKLLTLFGKKCQKILLINPLPFEPELFSISQARNRRYYAWPPYGTAVLATTLKNRGFEPKILDLNFDTLSYALGRPETEGPEIEQVVRQLWKDKTLEAINSFHPDCVGISCMFTMTHKMMLTLSEYIKSIRPTMPVLAGGVHISNAPDFVLREGWAIDFAGLNECDVSFVDTLDFVRGKVGREKLSQLGTMIEGEYVTIKNRAAPSAEELNIEPDYCDLPIGEYSALGEVGTYRCWLPNNFKASSVLSNRGCRAHCSFCSVANFNGKGVRQRDVESVLDEIQHLKEHHGVNHIAWIDDDLFFNKTRAVALFEGIKNRNLNITWCASNGVIASATSSAPELLKAAVDSGCIGITFGVESGNDEILKDVHKPSGVKHFLKVGEMMKEYPRVFTRGFLIIGFPNEKLSQIKDTISLANKMDLDWYGIQLLSPLPNTEIYKTMVQLGIITDKEFEKNSDKDGNKFFTLRQGEKQRKEEEEGAKQATSFINVLDTKPDSHIPTREELHELWLVVDFLINYKPVLELQDLPKLKKKQAILRDICNRFTKANPLANLTLSIVEDRLGDKVQAEYRRSLTSQYLSSSAYWRTRFEAFDLYKWLGNETKIIISENPDESFKADDLRKSGGYVV